MSNWSKESLEILRDRYFLKNDEGELIETKPEQMIKRVSNGIAQAEMLFGGNIDKSAKIFYEAIINKRMIPASPILFNANTPIGMLSSCFFFSIKDDLRDIFDRMADASYIFSRAGGCGFDFSNLRSKGTMIRSSKGKSTGPVSFMKVFNEMAEAVKGGGRRKAAMISILDIEHPDIEEFITAKTKEGDLSNFNISIKVSDEFMKEVKIGDKKALKKWRLATEAAWNNGEPGILFSDTIKINYAIPSQRHLLGVNPCSELILPSGGSCNLTSLNLPSYSKTGEINWEQLKKDVYTGIRFLDDCIEINKYPLPEVERISKDVRQAGLGIMGWAFTLMDMNISYGSQESYRLAEEVMEFISYYSHLASSELAVKRGTFPLIKNSIYETREAAKRGLQSKYERPKLDYTHLRDMIAKNGIRNSSCNCIAPTGTISRIADSYFSIEPIFSVETDSKILDGKVQKNIIPEKYRKHPNLVIKDDLNPEDHIKMVAAFQKYTDSSISKTINMPNSATVEDVEKAFMLAYDMKLKAITVYRDQSRKDQVLNVPKECRGGKCEI